MCVATASVNRYIGISGEGATPLKNINPVILHTVHYIRPTCFSSFIDIAFCPHVG
ncbi:hypothetical protein LJC48_07270 [Desulfovibrio sp. OttesenSCG-928-C06]|nr:hypothetical protein [Desulfovibrio sp. OttesenSCG-928-C06]